MRDFNHTVNVLVRAYLNDTLFHGRCAACAVGNMIADSLGETISNVKWSNRIPCWDNVFVTVSGAQSTIDMGAYFGEAKKQIDATGYSVTELAKIEFAFESVEYGTKNSDQHMLDGLFAVVDVLAEIHGISLEQKSVAKAMFVKETL